MTITGQFILKEARHEAYATIALMFFTYLFLRRTRARYDPTSSTLPLEVATVMDISLTQEEEARKRTHKNNDCPTAADAPFCDANVMHPPMASARSYELNDRRTQTTSSIPDAGTMTDQDSELGTRIGGFDPFQLAYMQPALRANPQSKPEQPFPPAQLGREDVVFTCGNANSGSEGDLVFDGGATVRLKSLNQQDRRLVNRWWKDQLQRCGQQNILSILIGEECGTLTIGRGANLVDAAPGQHVLV